MEKTSTGKIIQSVQRAIDILNCFDDLNTALTLGQISERLALNKSTVHGILNTLHCNDFVRQIPTGQYMLGPAMLGRHHQEGEVRRKVLLECARIVAVLIAPTMPRTPERIFAQIGVTEPELKTWESVKTFGGAKPGTAVHKGGALFPRIDVAKELEQLEAEKQAALAAAAKPEIPAPADEEKTVFTQRDLCQFEDF